MVRSVFTGVGLAIVLAFPLAALIALVYRFPVPFAGYLSGPKAMFPALVAVFFYGILGGFVVIALLGAAAGVIAEKIALKNNGSPIRIVLGLTLAADLAALFVLAILDKIIGPW